MKRISMLATALAVTGSALLTPAVASADPVITITSEGIPVEEGPVGGYEQPIHIDISGCITDLGEPAYIGYFLSSDGDLAEQFEALTGPGGALTLDPVVGLETTDRVVELNWYCSDNPVSDTPDAEPYSILYLSPTYTYTIVASPDAGANRMSAAKTSASKTTTAKKRLATKLSTKKALSSAEVSGDVTLSGAVDVTTDPNALPTIDNMGITGAKAAALKVKVDKRANDNLAVARLQAALARKPLPTPTNTQYVTATYQVLAGKAPSTSTMAPYVNELNQDGFRVNVVEQVALTMHTAAYYNH